MTQAQDSEIVVLTRTIKQTEFDQVDQIIPRTEFHA